MRSGPTVYPVDRYMVESSNKMEMVNVTDDEIWIPTPAIRPEDEAMLDRLGAMLRAAARDLALVSGQLAPRPRRSPPPAPRAPLDPQFNEKVHIEDIVNAKFHRYNIDDKPLSRKSQNEAGIRSNLCIKPLPKTVNASVQVNRLPKPTKTCKKKLALSRTRIVQIDEQFSDNVKDKLNNTKCSASGPYVAYNEFSYIYDEPKVKNCNQKPLNVQEMPSINIRSELREQKVLQLDILPEEKMTAETLETPSNVAVIALQHEPAPKAEKRITHYPQVVRTAPLPTKPAVRRVSKMMPCDSSDSNSNVSSDPKARIVNQKINKPPVLRPPSRRIFTNVDTKNKNNAKIKVATKTQNHRNIDEWKKKINTIYGLPSTSKTFKTSLNPKIKKSPKKSNTVRDQQNLKSQLNNAEYIPYSKLTVGGIRASDIEREISDIPDKNIPLSPILDKILTSRENSFYNNPSKKGNKHVLTTSDENLLEEVLDIERNVTKTLRKNIKKKVSPTKSNMSSESDKSDKNMTYADDFEEERTDHDNSLSDDELKSAPGDEPHDENVDDKVQAHAHNATFTKSSNLSLKNSVDIFEFVHSIDMQDHATQSNPVYKISLKATQTSPRNVQPIHNDLWPSAHPREEADKKLNEELIKKLIMDECSDILQKNLAQPSASKDKEEGKKNFAASQKNTQTSPAHVRSVMTSPTKTKTRTTSPLALALTVDRHTSPAHAHQDLRIDLDEINELALSINLSSPRFSLRLPRSSRDVLSNLDASPAKFEGKSHNTAVKCINKCSSSSSAEGDYSSSDISSLGEIERKFKRRMRKSKIPTISESSASSIVSKYNSDVSSVILPLRSEGEVSAGRGEVRRSRFSRSDGEVSLGQTLH